MLENLFNLVKEFSGEAVVNNPAVPNEQNDEVTAEATKTVAGGLQNMMAGGGLENILSLFKGDGNQQQGSGGLLKNPIVTMMIGHFASKLMSKFNMGSNEASSVANNLIPSVVTNLVNPTNDPSDNSFNINSIIGALSGGAAQNTGNSGGGFDFQNILNSFTGGGSDHGGGNGLADIISQVTNGAQQQQQQQGGGGGLMDMIKGFMK